MEGRRRLDPVGGAGIGPRILLASVFLAFGLVSSLSAAEPSPQFDSIAAIKQSFDQQRWQEVVEQAQALPGKSADVDYYWGVALARLGRWAEARAALLRGRRPSAAGGTLRGGTGRRCV